MKYAICGVILALAILGVYCGGYAIGSRDVKIECANKEKEVVIQEKEVITIDHADSIIFWAMRPQS